MTDRARRAISILEIVGIFKELTGLRYTGVYTTRTDKEQANSTDGEDALYNALYDASYAFNHISAQYIIQSILLGIGSNDSSKTADMSGVIKRLRFPSMGSEAVQYGGGVGGGYQVYCDGHLIITSGGGCGGGVSFDGAEQLSMGGGCGGGMQLSKGFGSNSFDSANDTAIFYTIGGGGGCGTCIEAGMDTTHSNVSRDAHQRGKPAALVSQMVCGDSVDYNALSFSDFRSIIRSQYKQANFQKLCSRVTVAGGGGGGGGFTKNAGDVVGAGYGYSFYLSSSPDEPIVEHPIGEKQDNDVHNTVHEVTNEEFSQLMLTNQQSGYPLDQSTPYETFSRLVQDSVAFCRAAGDWVCICRSVRKKLAYCAYKTRKTSGGGASSAGKIGVSGDESSHTTHCGTINRFNATFASMLQDSCPNDATSSSSSSTDNSSRRAITDKDLCDSTNDPEFSVATALGPSISWTVSVYDRNFSTSARALESLLSQLAATNSGGAHTETSLLMGLSLPSRGYEQSNAFILFELFAACTVVFMIVVAWLKVFGGHTHRYTRIPDLPDHA